MTLVRDQKWDFFAKSFVSGGKCHFLNYFYSFKIFVNNNQIEFDFLFNFIFEGVAGMVSKTSVAPLDRIKILLQVHHKSYKQFGKFIKIVYQNKLNKIY